MFTYIEKYRPKDAPYAKRVVEVYENGDFIGQIEEGEAYYYFMYWDGDRLSYGTRCANVADGKRKLQSSRYQPRRSSRPENCNAACLPSGNADDFYPTPSALAGRMFAKVDWSKVEAILEPSAGKGDLVDCMASLKEKFLPARLGRHPHRARKIGVDSAAEKTDVIECDANLRLILRAKGYRLISDDFLTFTTNKRYDLILMNPPFSNGDEHLLKAIQLMESGGQIVCLLNAETIRNPYTQRRRLLMSLLSKYEAHIEFIANAFKHAQRKTDVEIALVYLNIPRPKRESKIFSTMRKAAAEEREAAEPEALMSGSGIQQLLQQYQMEAKSGIALLEEYDALSPYIMSGNDKYDAPLLSLGVGNRTERDLGLNESINRYLRLLRGKYWRMFLDRPAVKDRLTTEMEKDYRAKTEEMADYEFDMHNIMQLMYDINTQLTQGVEDSINALFEKLSVRHSWYPECENNIHYYTGWKTNQAHKVGMKSIIPVHGCCCDKKWSRETLDRYTVYSVISDLERALNFLDKGETVFHTNIEMAINNANDAGSNKAEFTYFTATFYKKGTCHIKFKPEAAVLIDRLNIFAARQRSWLPPDYGKKSYDAMTAEEQQVIDSFQGREAYEKVAADPASFLLDGISMMALPAGA